jgi:hypothetical protein
MLVRHEVERAVGLQAKGYQLLRWLEKALDKGLITPEAAHAHATLEESAYAWIDRHYLNLPSAAQPAREDLLSFSKLFSTYLLNTFDLESNPGFRLSSPDAHCFCPYCTWMVRVPHLRPKKIGVADKKRAERMERGFILALAAETAQPAVDDLVEGLLHSPELREPLGLCAYAVDLLQRLKGIAIGTASLALWRSFAWTPQGSPKQGFTLSATAIMDAQQTILERLAVGQRR